MATDDGSLSSTLIQNHVPEIAMIVMGVVALLVVYMYLKDKDSSNYKLTVLLGVFVGIAAALIFVCTSADVKYATATLIIAAIGAFALIIRPFRDVKFAVLIALLVMVIVYIWLGDFKGHEQLDAISHGWPRIVIAFVAGAIVFMLLQFLQAIVLFFAKFFNCWPVLAVIAVFCIAEGICMLSGHGTIYEYLKPMISGDKASSILGLLL